MPARVCLMVAAVTVSAACGTGGDGDTSAAVPPPALVDGTGPATSTTSATDSSVLVTTTIAAPAYDCERDRRTFEVAMEAHYAMEGRFPKAEHELVEAGLLRAEIASFELVNGKITPVPGVQCEASTAPETPEMSEESPDETPVMTTDELFATLSTEQIELFGGRECAVELAAIASANLAFTTREGRDPTTLAELAGDLDRPIELWELAADQLGPVAGSGCADLDRVDTERACQADYRTLQVAREAFAAMYGTSFEPSEDDLVDEGLLRSASSGLDIADGEIVAVPGGECAGVELDASPDAAPDCNADRRTLEVAAEAYSAQFGEWPVDEKDLVATGMLRTVSPAYDLEADGAVVPAPGGGCE
jgi:hypothetical protein